MRRIGTFLSLSLVIFLPAFAQQEVLKEKDTKRQEVKTEETKIEEHILVTASKLPMLRSQAARSILVIDREEIKSLPVTTAEELLKFVAGFDFQSRGAFGLQVDPSLRGGTFEQVLVLINGQKFNDPQTGHNTLNLPLSVDDIERIEILKGPGSRLYGPNALTGIINIITRSSQKRTAELQVKTGQNDYQEVKANLEVMSPKLKNNVSFSTRKSTGYTHNTDFKQSGAFSRFQYEGTSGILGLQAGYSEKAFGASGFYSPNFPEQWEKVKAAFVALDSNNQINRFTVQTRLSWKHSRDEFLLDRYNPDFYHNVHLNNSFGGEITSSLSMAWGQISTGFEWKKDTISSHRLGKHERTYLGFFLEHHYSSKRLNFLFGLVAYNYPGYGWKIRPGIELSYRYARGLSQFFSYNQAFRLPTFTELYYYDPANQGNSFLKPEEARELETGWRYASDYLDLETSFFLRQGFNLIDWVKISLEEPWRAENIAEVNTNGLEINIVARKNLLKQFRLFDSWRLSYVNYRTDKDISGYLSKYALSSLKEQFIFSFQTKKLSGFQLSLAGRYFSRINKPHYFIVDGKISWLKDNLEIFLEGTNLSNVLYYDTAFIPAPPRWLIFGLKVKITVGDSSQQPVSILARENHQSF